MQRVYRSSGAVRALVAAGRCSYDVMMSVIVMTAAMNPTAVSYHYICL